MLKMLVATERGAFVVPGEEAALEGRRVDALATQSGHVWAVVDEHAVWRLSPDDAWRPVTDIEEFQLNCLSAHSSGLLAGTSKARLFAVRDGEVEAVSTFDAAPGRETWFTPWGGPPDVRSMAVSEGRLFVNVHVGGILTTDDLDDWTPTIPIESDVHQVLVHQGSVLAATAWGLAASDDLGATWSWHRTGLHATYSRAVAACDQAVLLSASEGPRGRRAAVYRLVRGSDELIKCENDLPTWFDHNIDTGCLAGLGGVAAFATQDGDVFVSEDSGASWRQQARGLPPARALMLLP